MKKLLHRILMSVIPWKYWGYPATSRLMRWNHWANQAEFEAMAEEARRKRAGRDQAFDEEEVL